MSDDELVALLEGQNTERGRAAWAAFREDLRRSEEQKRLRKSYPWLGSLIDVLLNSSSTGMPRLAVIRELRRQRKAHGLPMPKEFEGTIQHYYNQNCLGYSGFRKRKLPETEALFYSPEGKGSGIWAVHRERGAAWIKQNFRSPH